MGNSAITPPTLPPATAFRPRHLQLLMGGLNAAWQAGLLPPADLCPQRLRATAERSTGLSSDTIDRDFFETQLAVLLDDLHHEARLTDFGRLVAHGAILKVMKERLWFEALLNAHPEIDRIALAPPLIVVGPMRSGSTRMQRLLAADPAHDALRLYEAQAPVPSPAVRAARARGRRDPRIRHVSWALRLVQSINPALAAIHPTGPLEVDEELGLNEQSLSGAIIEAQRRVPHFARHCETVDQLPAYRRLERLLKLRCWFNGSDPARPLVLKTPQHMQDLAALHAVLPRAHYLFLHRDPVQVVASSASLAWNQMVVQSDHVDPHWVGAEWLHKTAHRMRVTSQVRQQIAPAQQMDLHFSEVDHDWHQAITRVYRWLNRDLRPEALAAMQAYVARAATTHRYRHHHYRISDFGLHATDVRTQLLPLDPAAEPALAA